MTAVIAVILQGEKRSVLGSRAFDCPAGHVFLTSMRAPVTGQVTRASAREPFLGVGLVVQPSLVASLRLEAPAERHGVTPMALYWHVKNKDELLDAMGDELFAGISAEVDSELPWLEQLRALVERLVEGLRRHPGSATLAYQRVLVCEPGLRLSEAVFSILLDDAGFSDADAAHIGAQALRNAVVMVADQPGRTVGDSDEARDELHAAKREHIATLPADAYPHVRRVGSMLLDCDLDDYFRIGIDLYVSGVERMAAAHLIA